MVENGATPVSFDLASQAPVLDVLSNAIWLYDAVASKNVWGNIAALDLFAKTPSAFKAHQPSICADALHKFKPDAWAAANTKLQEDVQERRLQQQVKVERSSGDSPPGFLPLPAKWESVSAVCKPVQVVDGSAAPRTVVIFQACETKKARVDTGPGSMSRTVSLERKGSGVVLEHQNSAARRSRQAGTAGDSADGAAASASCGACGCSGEESRSAYEKRLTEMCDNHALFNFLFDKQGELLAANKRAMDNMREHLGDHPSYNLKQYLSIGEFDVAVSVDTIYEEAMRRIFEEGETCHRFPQMRWSKRHPGKSRWVLYEMWPINDPITGQPAVLVTEQNISQVKNVEEQYSKQMQRLEAQLEEVQEALAAKVERTDPWSHLPKIDIDTPAEKTLKLLERLLGGTQVSQAEAEELRDAILQASDLSQPVNLDEKLLSGTAAMYEQEVGASLLQLLSTRNMAKESDDHPVTPVRMGEHTGGGGSNGGSTTSSGSHALNLPSSYYYSPSGNSSGSNAIGRLSGCGGGPHDVGMALDGVLVAGHGTLASAGDNGHGGNDCAQNGTYNAVKELLAVVRAPPTPEMELVLAKAEEWQFDSFQLEKFIGGRPLSLLAFYLIKRSELISKFDLDEHRLARFLIRAEEGYPNNPYHNRMHAADVLRSTHVLATRGGLIHTGYCDDMALLASYLAAIMHDFEHRGVNNDFLVRTADPLAILYNDRSPMENHHLAAAFQLLSCDEFNFLKRLPHKTRESLRKLVIDMVLATDMKQHFAITGNFTSKLNHNISNSARTSGAGAGPAASAAKSRTVSSHQARHTEDDAVRKPPDEENRSLTLQVMLKCADLGHLATPATVHRQWVQCLEEEFFRQGDREKAAGLTVSPLMDRDKAGITKSQVGFFDIVALPLFQSFSQKFPEAEPLLAAVKENYEMWKDESPSPVAAGSAAGSGGSFSTAASALANGRTGSGLLSKAHSGGGGLLALRTTSSAGGSLAQANA